MKIEKCPKCSRLRLGKDYCTKCNHIFIDEEQFKKKYFLCKRCETVNLIEYPFCYKCGYKTRNAGVESNKALEVFSDTEKDSKVAILVCPNCAGRITEIKPGKNYTCQYCGTSFTVNPEVIINEKLKVLIPNDRLIELVKMCFPSQENRAKLIYKQQTGCTDKEADAVVEMAFDIIDAYR